jgi:alpha/beta superfamily hydrolase
MRTERLEFPNGRGETLAARLELPEEETRGVALFAHCFTCGMHVHAATRISRALAGRGIATLRFDFTGLGSSEGDFANESFSSNVEDLVAAADHLGARIGAPRILVGHSLGGAAVLAAAMRMEGVALVATIGAPADPVHARRLFVDHLEEIETHGRALVHLDGRAFPISKRFIDDLGGHGLLDRLPELRSALVVFHAPGDEVVEIEQARRIFDAAPHPKSFVSLADADHLLTRPEDAQLVADLLCTWGSRYLD